MNFASGEASRAPMGQGRVRAGLWRAACDGNLNKVKRLIRKGVRIDEKDKNGVSVVFVCFLAR